MFRSKARGGTLVQTFLESHPREKKVVTLKKNSILTLPSCIWSMPSVIDLQTDGL